MTFFKSTLAFGSLGIVESLLGSSFVYVSSCLNSSPFFPMPFSILLCSVSPQHCGRFLRKNCMI